MVFDELEKDTMEMKTTLGKSVMAVSAPNEEPLNTLAQDDVSFAALPYLTREISATSFASAGVVDTNTVTLAAGHGVTVGDSVAVKGLYIGRALVVVGNVITLNQRFNLTYPVGTVCYRVSSNMVVNGSTTPIFFGLEAGPGIKFDVYKMRLAFRGTSEMDDAKFASLTALTKGMIVRAKISSTRYNNYFNARSNSEFHLRGKLSYNDKAPSGNYGMIFEFPLKDDNGVALRIDGTAGTRIEVIIQDNLTTGGTLTYMEGTVSGHVVED